VTGLADIASPQEQKTPAPKEKPMTEPIKNIIILKTGSRPSDEMWYIQQVIESIGLSLTTLSGVHIDNIRCVTADKLNQTYVMGLLMGSGHDASKCTLTPFNDRDGGSGRNRLFGTRVESSLSQRANNYRKAVKYLDSCGPFNEEKLREANRIAGNPLTEDDVHRFVQTAPSMLSTGGKRGGMEGVRDEMRKSLTEGIAVFGSL
jgi:hypothetical protein